MTHRCERSRTVSRRTFGLDCYPRFSPMIAIPSRMCMHDSGQYYIARSELHEGHFFAKPIHFSADLPVPTSYVSPILRDPKPDRLSLNCLCSASLQPTVPDRAMRAISRSRRLSHGSMHCQEK